MYLYGRYSSSGLSELNNHRRFFSESSDHNNVQHVPISPVTANPEDAPFGGSSGSTAPRISHLSRVQSALINVNTGFPGCAQSHQRSSSHNPGRYHTSLWLHCAISGTCTQVHSDRPARQRSAQILYARDGTIKTDQIPGPGTELLLSGFEGPCTIVFVLVY